MPLAFELGEAFQFDWSEEGLVVGGIYYRMQVSHLKLCASRAFWLVAYPSQGHEMLFDAHTRSFAAMGGIAKVKFGSFVELNAWLGDRCRALWEEVRHPEHDQFSVAEMLDNERPHLMPATARPSPICPSCCSNCAGPCCVTRAGTA